MTTTLQIENKNVLITDGLLKIARMEDEWYDIIDNPKVFLQEIKSKHEKADIFTFRQWTLDQIPKYNYYMEWDDIAVLSIKSYDHWWLTQINSSTRSAVRKAAKKEVVIREAEFNDDFVRGMVSIFNESPIRQGKPFWHYGKGFETVRKEFSKYLSREDLIGSYYKDELIGFVMLGHMGKFAFLRQIISKIEHRDKSTNNALIAKAVEMCDSQQIPYLVYAYWNTGSLVDFKRHNGFERVSLPRYYVPLTAKGQAVLKLGLHRGLQGVLPDKLKARLIQWRSNWYRRRNPTKSSCSALQES
jgi:hypothetical protein